MIYLGKFFLFTLSNAYKAQIVPICLFSPPLISGEVGRETQELRPLGFFLQKLLQSTVEIRFFRFTARAQCSLPEETPVQNQTLK